MTRLELAKKQAIEAALVHKGASADSLSQE